ncbi:MAG: hypothetical protein ACRD3W_23065 [Terriglobales bacterium]
MQSKLRRDFDPLEVELMERAFESAWAAVKGNHAPRGELDTDEELEAKLRCELVEIALSYGVSDPETLRDILLGTLSGPEGA